MRRLRSQRGRLRASTSSPGITSCFLATATSRVIPLAICPVRGRASAQDRAHGIVVVVVPQGTWLQSAKGKNDPPFATHWQSDCTVHCPSTQHADGGVVVVARWHGIGSLQSPGPTCTPPAALQAAGSRTWQTSNGPQKPARRQHRCPVVGVVVVVAGQLGPEPLVSQASQQLVHVPTVPPLASQEAALRIVLHFDSPFLVRQQVTEPGLPQVDFEAHFLTRPRQPRFRSTASACCVAQRT
jgi:hypothetical protein